MAEKKAQHGKNSVDETGFLAQSTRHPFRDPDSPREPDPQETKVKKILSSVFAVVFAMAFSLVCQPSVSSAAPQGAPASDKKLISRPDVCAYITGQLIR